MFDQTVKKDAGKVLLTLAPRKIMTCIARVRMWAISQKYKGPESWRSVEIERYREATYRHFYAYLDNPHGVDKESGLPHLWHLATNVAFLCELEDADSDACADWTDDSDICGKYAEKGDRRSDTSDRRKD